MNRCYRLVWDRNFEQWRVAHERARSRGKRSGALRMLAAAAALAGFAPGAHALPTGGQVSAGTGSISQSGADVTVTQVTPKLAVNWRSFGIAADESVTFRQPDASAIALNRILGTDPSQIYGRLSANGQVFLLNPNGILFAPGAQVNVGGLVASTLNLSDADFMAGRYSFAGSGGSVVNQGAISASDGGYVALLGAQVSNEGTIHARLGTVALAAGNQVTLDFAGDGLVSLQVDQGAVDALARNKQLIRADGGTVLLTAKAASALETAVVNNSGVVEAQTIENKGGVIRLLGDPRSGVAQVGGTLDASAPAGGDGGLVETSAAKVQVADGAVVTTAAPAGRAGTWLIDPNDFTVAEIGGDTTGAALSSSLASGNVAIESSGGGTSGAGDINVDDAVSWSADYALTLNASNDINVNAGITATGAASGLNLHANSTSGIDGASGSGSVNIVNNMVNVAGSVSVTGVDLNVGSATAIAPSLLQGGSVNAGLDGAINVVGGAGGSGVWAAIRSNGTQSLGANAINVHGGSGTHNWAMIGSGGDQQISAAGITILGGGGTSYGNYAQIAHYGGGNQNITVTGGGALTLQAGSGTGTATGNTSLVNGICGADPNCLSVPVAADWAGISSGAGNQSVIFQAGGTLSLTGGSGGNENKGYIANIGGGSQSITGFADITLSGGSSGGSNYQSTDGFFYLRNNAAFFSPNGSQTIDASSLTLNGLSAAADPGTVGDAVIYGNGQTVTVNNAIALNSGGSSVAYTQIKSVGDQAISAGFIGLYAGADGAHNIAQIFANGDQQISTSMPAGIVLQGGGGPWFGNFAQIGHGPGTGNQTISIGSGGSVTLTAGNGTGATTNDPSLVPGICAADSVCINTPVTADQAGILSTVGNQSLIFQSGGMLSLTGGAGGNRNSAFIASVGGSQSISGFPSITLTGGASGGNDYQTGDGFHYLRDNASLFAPYTAQSIQADSLTLHGVSAAADPATISSASITGGSQSISVTQAITLSSGGTAVAPTLIESRGPQSVTAGSILLGAGSGGANNTAEIRQVSSFDSQTIAATGVVTLIGGPSGVNEGAFITSSGPSQGLSAGGITLQGGGGADGISDVATIAQWNAGGSQSITVNGGGSIDITGGSGSGGANFAQIFSAGSGPQTIAFTAGGAINLTSGTGAIVSTAGTSNFARIEATAGDQTISGLPSITIQGGTGGGTSATPGVNLGNFAFIRADTGVQSIDAGAISLAAGASGIDSSATIQGVMQNINALSVSLSGGGATGTFSGARIGGRGGAAGGPTNLTLTTTGPITLTGGAASGAGIGDNPSGGGPTEITIIAGGDVTLQPGTGAGVRIGSTAGGLQDGNISINSQGSITLGENGAIGSGIYTLGDVSLTASAPGGAIAEQPASRILANSLTTVSDAGTLLNGSNQVAGFGATNFTSGSIVLNDNVPSLNAGNVWNNAAGGSLSIANSSDVNVTGNLFTANGGYLSLTAGGNLIIGNPTIGVSVIAGADAGNTGDMTLSGANIGILGGNGGFSTYVGLNGSGTQQVTTSGTLGLAATGASGGAVYLTANDSAAQQISVGGDLVLLGGEGTGNAGTISVNGSGAQTVTVGGTLTATAGGNYSNGSGNNAYIIQNGSGPQAVSANAIALTGGGGSMGAGNSAAIFTSPNSSGSQQVTVGGGGLSMQGGTGSGSGNKAGIWVLDDYSTNHGTSSAQTLSVAGNIALTGGSNGDALVPNNNNASIFQSSTGAGATQSVSALGSIRLTGGASGANGGAYITSQAPAQSVSATGIVLQGAGGTDGTNDGAGIVQNDAAGAQSVTVNGGGSIVATGGSGSGGSNAAQINSVGSGPQTIAFPAGGAINLTGGTGVPVSTAAASNYAKIEANAGDQSVTGAPSITVLGGTDGGSGGATNLGNYAYIRADAGVQTIDAGAISLAAGVSGIDSSATIQGVMQTINASSVSISGGGASGTFAGARIGGHGGYVYGPTNLTLTATGSITVAGGSGSGAAIGANSLGGTTTDVTINSGGDVTLQPGTGAGVRIGETPSTLSGGNISITSAGTITLGQNGSIGSGIYTAGDVSVSANAPGGSILEQPASRILANALTTSSDAGTLLNGANQVASFGATNATSGNVSLVNTANPLTIIGITNSGGDVSVDNTGAVVTTGLISAPSGSVSIVAHSPLTIGGAGVTAAGGVVLSAGQTANPGDVLELDGPVSSTGGGSIVLSAGDDLLQNANVSSNGGSVSATSEAGSITMAAGTTTSSGGGTISYSAATGDISVSSLDAGTGSIYLSAGGNVQPTSGSTGVNLTGDSANVTAGGDVTLTTQLTLPANVTAGGTVSVTNQTPCKDDDCDEDEHEHGHHGHHKHHHHDRGHHRQGDGDRGKDGWKDSWLGRYLGWIDRFKRFGDQR